VRHPTRRRIENNLGTSGHAAIGGVTKSVHMEPVEPPGLSLEMLPVTVVGPYLSTNKANGFETSHKRRRIGHEESKKKSAGNYHLPLERTRRCPYTLGARKDSNGFPHCLCCALTHLFLFIYHRLVYF
jgi:hypothetical protein